MQTTRRQLETLPASWSKSATLKQSAASRQSLTTLPPMRSWEQVKEAEQDRRGREEARLLEWQEKDRQALISRAEGGGWPHEELIEKLRSQAETHAQQQERQIQDQQERLERLRLTNGKERDRSRDRSLDR